MPGRASVPITLVVPLAIEALYQTDGSTTQLQDVLDLPQVRNLGPLIKRIRVHWELENATADFRFQVSLAWSVSGKQWTPSSTLVLTAQGTAGNSQNIGNWYTLDSTFGLHMRYAIEVFNNTTGPLQNGRITAYLEIELK